MYCRLETYTEAVSDGRKIAAELIAVRASWELAKRRSAACTILANRLVDDDSPLPILMLEMGRQSSATSEEARKMAY
jgi:hypothetical protein